ncbi:hypothetical protein AVEN_147796-1 [Araneus ventricosus]|uniref:Uncharacterized protein n=1 Tax=Araneus ventricosus TaxID=182803 RepID=A0A4Y2UHC3_ARAVE|nr:hypothetical protein AVEN_147796-1 [Araneus ventricosus]
MLNKVQDSQYAERECYFWTDLVILERGQMKRTTPQSVIYPSTNFHSTPAGVHHQCQIKRALGLHTGVLWWNRVANLGPSGFETGILLPRLPHSLVFQ